MSRIASATVREFLLDRYGPRLAAKNASPDRITDDYDLLRQGIIDSLGILEMVGAVESEFGIELDLENLDAEDLTKIGPFCRYVEQLSHLNVNSSEDSSPNGAASN